MRVVCAYLCEFRDREDYFISLMPSGVPSIAAYLERDGHTVVLANLSQHGAVKGSEIITQQNPDAVTVSIFSFNRHESFRLITELKKRKKNLIIIAGGQHPTFLHKQIHSLHPEIDFIIRGEGEIAVSKIINNIKDFKIGSIIKEERILRLDSIPYPSQFSGTTIGVNPHEQYKYIITTRGCPSSCRYCSSPNFWERKVTYRSPENIINELKAIRQKYGIIYFSIRDDNFTLNKTRVLEFCRLLNESKMFMMWNCQARVDTIDLEMLIAMKSCGLEHIQYGIESGSEKILKLYEKSTSLEKIIHASEITRKAGVYLSFYLMAGMEGENDEDIDKTISILHKSLPHDSIISPVAYYPGTDIYNSAKKDGKINDSIWEKKSDNGLYLIDKKISGKWIKKILSAAKKVSAKAIYRETDFAASRKLEGTESFWMTDILEGDYFLDSGDNRKAAKIFKKVIKDNPGNIWGYLKAAEAISDISHNESIKLLRKSAEIVPSYYGTWLSIARIEFEAGYINRALIAAEKAHSLNLFDAETSDFLNYLKKA